MALLHYDHFRCRLQGPRPRGRLRCCLLKGCDQCFRPSHPQVRYCSDRCRQLAQRWRRWYASQRYRHTDQGKHKRRQQSQRYRQRVRQAQAEASPDVIAESATAPEVQNPNPTPGEGQRPAEKSAKIHGCPCARPGCYVRFERTSRSPGQRFCSSACRKALRRVLDREAKWRRRHRGWRQPPKRPQATALPP